MIYRVDLGPRLRSDRDREAQVPALPAQLLGDDVLVAIVRAHDRERGCAELGLVAAEHLDRQVAGKRKERWIGRHSSQRLISSTTFVQRPPAPTGFNDTSGCTRSCAPPNDT